MRGFWVFTYGTLEVPDVMGAVTGRVYNSAEAITEGYARYLLKGTDLSGYDACLRASELRTCVF